MGGACVRVSVLQCDDEGNTLYILGVCVFVCVSVCANWQVHCSIPVEDELATEAYEHTQRTHRQSRVNRESIQLQ
jgi:predicted small metal-binding protein